MTELLWMTSSNTVNWSAPRKTEFHTRFPFNLYLSLKFSVNIPASHTSVSEHIQASYWSFASNGHDLCNSDSVSLQIVEMCAMSKVTLPSAIAACTVLCNCYPGHVASGIGSLVLSHSVPCLRDIHLQCHSRSLFLAWSTLSFFCLLKRENNFCTTVNLCLHCHP